MVAAIETCRTSYKTACLTNNFASAERVVSAEVAAVYASSTPSWSRASWGCANPIPASTSSPARRLGVAPEESVFLDDLGVNLKPARALGMRTIKVTDPEEALAELGHLLGLSFAP